VPWEGGFGINQEKLDWKVENESTLTCRLWQVQIQKLTGYLWSYVYLFSITSHLIWKKTFLIYVEGYRKWFSVAIKMNQPAANQSLVKETFTPLVIIFTLGS
jgi:hypothetical protein